MTKAWQNFNSRNRWVFPKIGVTRKSSHFNRVFHYKPSIMGYPYFWKHPDLVLIFFISGIDLRFLAVLCLVSSASSGWILTEKILLLLQSADLLPGTTTLLLKHQAIVHCSSNFSNFSTNSFRFLGWNTSSLIAWGVWSLFLMPHRSTARGSRLKISELRALVVHGSWGYGPGLKHTKSKPGKTKHTRHVYSISIYITFLNTHGIIKYNIYIYTYTYIYI